MSKSRARYYKFRVKTKSGKARSGVVLASSQVTAHRRVCRLYKKPQKVHVFKTSPLKLKIY